MWVVGFALQNGTVYGFNNTDLADNSEAGTDVNLEYVDVVEAKPMPSTYPK